MTKIEGKFYPLQPEEWAEAWDELKPSEVRILYYLRMLDPFGDKQMEIGVTAIAKELGIAKSTVSKALKSLDAKGWIELELIKVKVRLKSVSSRKHCFPQETPVSPRKPPFPPGNTSFSQETPVSLRKRTEAESYTEQGLQNPKTNKTYTDFLKTLSEYERERFEKLCEFRISQISYAVQDPEKWLNEAYEEYWENFIEANSRVKQVDFPIRKGKNNFEIKQVLESAKAYKLIRNFFPSKYHKGDYAVLLADGKCIPALKWIEEATEK